MSVFYFFYFLAEFFTFCEFGLILRCIIKHAECYAVFT